jgi:hypothetical protein
MENVNRKCRFQVGTVVYSKADPQIKLLIMKYDSGIYHCAVVGDAKRNDLVFFESQLTVFEI